MHTTATGMSLPVYIFVYIKQLNFKQTRQTEIDFYIDDYFIEYSICVYSIGLCVDVCVEYLCVCVCGRVCWVFVCLCANLCRVMNY